MRNVFVTFTEFEWDDGNSEKNWLKHKVSRIEAEQVFFNSPLIVVVDEKNFNVESRYFLLGRTNDGRHLTIVATVRGTKIRVISARDMHKKERMRFKDENKKENP